MSTNPEEILSLFQSFQDSFDADQSVRETIRNNAVQLEQLVRQTMTTLQAIHLESSMNNYSQILNKASEIIPQCAAVYENLSSLVPQKTFYKYHDNFKMITQKAVFCLTLIEYLQSSKLATKEEVAAKLSLRKDHSEGFHLDLEDYLHGLLLLVSELSRLAVNSAASGDYKRPVEISHFVNELNAGFRLINFKNDALRKHYDCFKYDLKKIEEVVYDLSIRGLKRSDSKPATKEDQSNIAPDSSVVAT